MAKKRIAKTTGDVALKSQILDMIKVNVDLASRMTDAAKIDQYDRGNSPLPIDQYHKGDSASLLTRINPADLAVAGIAKKRGGGR